MNRLAEKILPAMNDEEVQELLLDHYRNESQTLTADTEANLLKLRELLAILSPEEQLRWDEIKSTFRRNQLSRGGGDQDPVGRVVGQLSAFNAGLEGIQKVLSDQLQPPESPGDKADKKSSLEVESRLRSMLHEMEMIHTTMAALQDLSIQQRDALEKAREQLAIRAKQGVIEVDLTDEMLANEQAFLDHFQKVLASRREQPKAEGATDES